MLDVTKMTNDDIEHVARLATDNPGDRRVWTGGDTPMDFSAHKIMRCFRGPQPTGIYILDDRQKFKIEVTPELRVRISNCRPRRVKNLAKIRRYVEGLGLPEIQVQRKVSAE